MGNEINSDFAKIKTSIQRINFGFNSFASKIYNKRFRYKNLNPNPFLQFETWFNEAMEAKLTEPNAFSLATVGTDMMPSIRTVLLKIFDEKGFVFFTNYKSNKAKQIEENPKAAALFAWLDLERQVKVEGNIEKISTTESLKYFYQDQKEVKLELGFHTKVKL